MSKRITSKKKLPKPNKEVQKAVQDLVLGMLSGSQDKVTLAVQLTIPRGLYQTYVALATQYGIPLEEFLSSAASSGLQGAMNQGMPEAPKGESGFDIAKAAGLDLSGLNSSFSKLQELAEQLTKVSEEVDERIGTDDQKDSK